MHASSSFVHGLTPECTIRARGLRWPGRIQRVLPAQKIHPGEPVSGTLVARTNSKPANLA